VRAVTDDDTGFKVLYEPPARESGRDEANYIDIVAIHGIGAHPDDTWTKKVESADGQRYINWLSNPEMLPAVAPNARVMRYGYESQWFGPDAIRQNTTRVANRFLLALKRQRQDAPFRPLVIVAHCFGGLVVLKALLEARHDQKRWPGIFQSTTGLAFFGTPFRGAEGMSQSEMIQAALLEYSNDQVQGEVLKVLDPGNELLQDLVDSFGKTRSEANKAQVACFFELKSSNIGAIIGGQAKKVCLLLV
ncbi:uncharacterized protein K452DRAFT_239791, partial [Aplosporella prunicola CBS 121167]